MSTDYIHNRIIPPPNTLIHLLTPFRRSLIYLSLLILRGLLHTRIIVLITSLLPILRFFKYFLQILPNLALQRQSFLQLFNSFPLLLIHKDLFYILSISRSSFRYHLVNFFNLLERGNTVKITGLSNSCSSTLLFYLILLQGSILS